MGPGDGGPDPVLRPTSSSTRTRDGIRQAVIVAGRPGTRGPIGCRGPEGTVVYEVDMPNVIEFKSSNAAQARCRADKPSAETVAVDLRDDWARGNYRPPAFDHTGPVGMERRRSGGLLAARSPGRAFSAASPAA